MSKSQFATLLLSIIFGFAAVCLTVYWVRPISDAERQARVERAKDDTIVKEFRDFMGGRKRWEEISDDLYGRLSDEELLGPGSIPVYESLDKMRELAAYLNLFADDNGGNYPENDDELLKAFPDVKDFLIDGWGQPIRWYIKPDSLDEPYMSSFITCVRPDQRKKYDLDLVLIGVPCSQRRTLIWQPPLGTFVADCDYGSALPLANSLAIKSVREEEQRSK